MTPDIDILLATYNGAAFLPEQLDSLEAQTHRKWRLIFRDDGSTDGSAALVREWAEHAGRECIEISDGETQVGPSECFARLIARSSAPWFACCDQDDVWKPEKLERLLSAGMAAEQDSEEEAPILVHCDLELVDTNLSPLKRSFWEDRRNDEGLRSAAPGHKTRLLMQGSVTGCAMLGNDALRRAALPIPAEARMHDWWLSLVAAWRGKLVAVDMPLVRYRQHGGNAVGSGIPLRFWAMTGRFLFDNEAAMARVWKAYDHSAAQTAIVCEKLGDQMTRRERAFASRYARIDHGLRRWESWTLLPWAAMHWRRWPMVVYLLLATFRRKRTLGEDRPG